MVKQNPNKEKEIKTMATVKTKRTGLTDNSDDSVFINKEFIGKNWQVLSTKVGGNMASVIFVFETEQQALEAARKIATAIGGECYGTNDPRK